MALASNPIWQLRYNLGADGNYNPFVPPTAATTPPPVPTPPGISPVAGAGTAAAREGTGRDNRGDASGNNSSSQDRDIGIERREYRDFFSWTPGPIIDQSTKRRKLAEGWGGGGTEESSGDSGISLLEGIGIGLGALLPVPGGMAGGYLLGGKIDDYNSLSDTIDIWGRPMDQNKSWWDKLTADQSFEEQEMSILNAGPTPAELDRMNRPGSGKDKGAFVPATQGPRDVGPVGRGISKSTPKSRAGAMARDDSSYRDRGSERRGQRDGSRGFERSTDRASGGGRYF